MYGKFIFSDINRLHYYTIIIYIFVCSIFIYLYNNIPNYENRLRTILLSQSIDGVDASADKLIDKIVNSSSNFIKDNSIDTPLRQKNIELLRDFQNRNIQSVYILLPFENQFFLFLDSSENSTNEPELFILNDIDKEYIIKAKETKTKQIYIQKDIIDLGFSMIKPIIKNNKLIAFLVIDYTQKTYTSLTSLLSFSVKTIMIFLIILIILLTIFILYFLRTIYIQNQMYRDSNLGIYYRSYLTDNYEKINFSDYYIALVDIDFFKRINDIYGQANGDRVLGAVIKRISSFLKKDDIFIQYGGEEFLLLISKKDTNVDEFRTRLEDIRKMVENLNIKIKKDTINITISIGAFIQTNRASSLQDAIQKADSALYDSKHNGRNTITYFDISDKIVMYREKLKDMIESDKLICFYQPIINLKTGEVHHYEALLRIEDGDNIIFPNQILPILENSYFYSRISMKVIEYNIGKLLENDKLKISLNLSSDDLINDTILAFLRKNSLLSNRILIEILETKDANYSKLESSIQKLKLLGYKFCIDDYGSGFSNLNHLLNLSIDYLKIDGTIIKNIDKDKKVYSLISSLNIFCQNNGIKVIAEFVENEKILDVLRELGIEYGQGYYFDKPKPYDEIIDI